MPSLNDYPILSLGGAVGLGASTGGNRDLSRPNLESVGNASASAAGGALVGGSPAPAALSRMEGRGGEEGGGGGAPLLESDVISLDKFKLDQVEKHTKE